MITAAKLRWFCILCKFFANFFRANFITRKVSANYQPFAHIRNFTLPALAGFDTARRHSQYRSGRKAGGERRELQSYYRNRIDGERSHIAADNAALGIADKHYDFVAFGGSGQLCLYALYSVGVIESGEVQVTVYLLNVADLL